MIVCPHQTIARKSGCPDWVKCGVSIPDGAKSLEYPPREHHEHGDRPNARGSWPLSATIEILNPQTETHCSPATPEHTPATPPHSPRRSPPETPPHAAPGPALR